VMVVVDGWVVLHARPKRTFPVMVSVIVKEMGKKGKQRRGEKRRK
jgi:hypothetical protein